MSLPAIFHWSMGGLNILVPKRRGTGYLACPLGHHYVAALSDIESDEGITICGLDGYLLLEYGYIDEEKRAEIEARVVPRLARHYGFKEWRDDSQEFWAALKA